MHSPLVSGARELVARLLGQDWKKLLRAEVNAPYFWGAAGALALFAFLVCAALLVRASMAARPTAPVEAVVEKEAQDRKHALEDAKKLFATGKYEQSLTLLRQVLARSPGNQQARQYAQMAENALAGRAEEIRKSAQAAGSVEAARAALAQSRYEDAVRHADEALAVDAGRTEAQELKDQAVARIAEARAADAEAARKKRAEDKKVAGVRRQPTAGAQARAERAVQAPGAPTTFATGPATLRLVFDSPISEGSVMIYVNDEKALQKPFDFSKKAGFFKRVDGTGTVEAPIPVKAGPVSVKVWLSGKGLPATAFTTVAGQLAGGETRTLRLEYSGNQLTAHIQ
jgi:tetratricopeptide (TPR) repeat protein